MSGQSVFGSWTSEPIAFKPIVRIGVVSYRVARLTFGEYEIVRILDDRRIGTFRSFPAFEVTSSVIHPAFVRGIARAAAKGTRASWVERLEYAWRRRAFASEQSPASG